MGGYDGYAGVLVVCSGWCLYPATPSPPISHHPHHIQTHSHPPHTFPTCDTLPSKHRGPTSLALLYMTVTHSGSCCGTCPGYPCLTLLHITLRGSICMCVCVVMRGYICVVMRGYILMGGARGLYKLCVCVDEGIHVYLCMYGYVYVYMYVYTLLPTSHVYPTHCCPPLPTHHTVASMCMAMVNNALTTIPSCAWGC